MASDTLTQVILPLALFIIMLGMGLSLKLADFSHLLQQPKAVIIGVIAQLCLLPLLGFLVITVFGLSGELAVGLMILTLCPGGTTSNLLSYLAKGDVALSISLTGIISIVTPFTIPFFTSLFLDFFMNDDQAFKLPIVKTIMQLIVITLAPVLLGMWLHKKAPLFAKKIEKPMKLFSIVFLFIIIIGIMIKNKDDMADFFIATGAASFSLNIAALVAGFILAKCLGLTRPQATTICIEVGIQNGTVALLVAGTLLGNSIMTIPAVTYSLLMFITGGLFAYLQNKLTTKTSNQS